MRAFIEGQSFYNIIKQTIPDFVDHEYPQFVEFVRAFLQFLENKRVTAPTTITPEFGGTTTIQETTSLGGPVYEARKMLEYRDAATTLDEFASHFNAMFAKNFPQYTYLS